MENLKPFKSDGCSGGMSWFWRKVLKKPPPWENLCIEHDRVYHKGGTVQQRRKADGELALGVVDKGYPITAVTMLLAIRLGGHPILPFSWRWGFGRPYFKSRKYDE